MGTITLHWIPLLSPSMANVLHNPIKPNFAALKYNTLIWFKISKKNIKHHNIWLKCKKEQIRREASWELAFLFIKMLTCIFISSSKLLIYRYAVKVSSWINRRSYMDIWWILAYEKVEYQNIVFHKKPKTQWFFKIYHIHMIDPVQ